MKYLNGIIDSISRSAPIDPDAQLFFNRVTAAGGTLTNTEKSSVNTLVISLKANSIWNTLTAIYPMVGSSAAACAQNLKSSSYTGTFSGGWVYASTGVKANGTNGYFNTNLQADIAGIDPFNCCYSVYSRTDIAQDSIDVGFARNSVTAWVYYTIRLTTTSLSETFLGTFPANEITYTNPDSLGFYNISRTSTNLMTTYKNGVSKGTNTTNTTYNYVIPPTVTFQAFNYFSGPQNFSSRENAFSSVGSGLSDAQSATFYTIVQNFQTLLSRQV